VVDQTNRTPNLYTLLIGIDCYLPNMLHDGSYYASLGGCVRDITHFEEFLQRKLGMLEERILKLTATNTSAVEPPGSKDRWPTYENMVAAFQELTEMAKSGDQVYIHYSGHGGRASTAFPELKGVNGLDEALVPADIGSSEARYLRDVELAHLLKAMVDKGLIVTVVLDSCHSGGATRGKGGAVARGNGSIDTAPRPTESLVASHDELAKTWETLSEGKTRAVKLGSGWLLEPKGYTLLAACRASESAYEYAFDGRERNGALTYWLLDSLRQLGPGLTYKQLHDRILAKVHGQFERQTPQLQGEGDRVVFGSDRVQPQYAVNVMRVEPRKQQVLLGAGQAHGLRKRAQFVIYPPGTIDISQVDQRLALVEIVDLGAVDSWARITNKLRPDRIEQGAQAVFLEPGTSRLQRVVRPMRRAQLPPSIDQDGALDRFKIALKQSGTSFVRLAENGEPADFQVAVNTSSEYEIWDSAGNPISNLRPALRIDDSQAPDCIVHRLVHLTQYHNVRELDNYDSMSPLARKLVVELVGMQSEYDPVDKPDPQPFEDAGNTPVISVGEWTFLRVRNDLPPGRPNDPSRILNITVLDLQPDWGIRQIFPSGAGFFEPLDPGQEVMLPLRADLPGGYAEGADVIKVFATLGTTNFRWLELPVLDQRPRRSETTRGGPRNRLEELLATAVAEEPRMRNLNPAAYPSKEWVTEEVEIRVRRVCPELS
jgi:hypothetical protein